MTAEDEKLRKREAHLGYSTHKGRIVEVLVRDKQRLVIRMDGESIWEADPPVNLIGESLLRWAIRTHEEDDAKCGQLAALIRAAIKETNG